MSICFLNDGTGLGSLYYPDIRVSRLGVNADASLRTVSYVRLSPTKTIAYYNGLTYTSASSFTLQYGVWYDVVQQIDLTNGKYSFTVQSQSNPADFYQSPTGISPLYSILNVGAIGIYVTDATNANRGGLIEVDNVTVETVPEAGIGALSVAGLTVMGGMALASARRGQRQAGNRIH